MDPAAAAKQQIVERLKQANNILVTVSNNPSVDQLSACIGLTLLLNKMDKHATAVFSGAIPSTIEFLQPEKTIETNTDSLRDFIISLDKNKADKLRYKVEDQVVRIFITPYRTSLSEKDLEFGQGDFNIEVVLALGVKERAQLDEAITAHGRILHDATVIALEAGKGRPPAIGQINWHDPAASSLCEMLVSISEAFGTGLIDNQMATAFLTGIVAQTQRFSNDKTSPKVMTMAAQLMAAGANQQLIVSKLEPPPPEPPPPEKPPKPPDTPPKKPPAPPEPEKPKTGILNVPHEPKRGGGVEADSGEIHIDEEGNLTTTAEEDEKAVKSSAIGPQVSVPVSPPVEKPALPPELPKPSPVPEPPAPPKEEASEPVEPPPAPAPAEVASKKKELKLEPLKPEPPPQIPQYSLPELPPTPQIKFDRQASLPDLDVVKPQAQAGLGSEVPGPHTLLNPSNYQPSISPPFTADTQPDWYDPESITPLDPLSDNRWLNDTLIPRGSGQSAYSRAQPADPTVDSARGAVQNAIAAAPYDPSGHPLTGFGAQPLSSELHVPAGVPSQSLPPPPPLPPPLTPSPGVVIPNPPQQR